MTTRAPAVLKICNAFQNRDILFVHCEQVPTLHSEGGEVVRLLDLLWNFHSGSENLTGDEVKH